MSDETKPATNEQVERARLLLGEPGVWDDHTVSALIARIDAESARANKAEAQRNDLRRELQIAYGDVRRAQARADKAAALIVEMQA